MEAYKTKALLVAIDAINKIPDDGCPYPELASEGYSLAIKDLWKMIDFCKMIKYLTDDD